MGLVDRIVPQEDLYARTGIQVMPFNTLYQLSVLQDEGLLAHSQTMLLLPDLLAYWLTGAKVAETTNASTTGLLDARTRTWASDIIAALGFPASIVAPLCTPGDSFGPIQATVARGAGLDDAPMVTAVGSHDTASAVVAVPADGRDFAYVSCGTWGLVGLELEAPILSDASRLANFTNESGVDGRVRYLRNVMGLWLLQETLRTWERSGSAEDLDGLLEGAATIPAGGPWIDPDDPTFLPPGDMVARIESACDRADQPRPASRAAVVRCILDSLAFAFARTVEEASRLAGRHVEVVHLVGGGAQNDLLCQLTANACGLPVVAGPVEATALGNIVVQARTFGQANGSLESLRALVRSTQPLRRFEPRLHSSPVNA
jgi:rhamnulokinase